jgi:hypothetical protein
MREGAEAIRTRHTDWKPWEDLWWLLDHPETRRHDSRAAEAPPAEQPTGSEAEGSSPQTSCPQDGGLGTAAGEQAGSSPLGLCFGGLPRDLV